MIQKTRSLVQDLYHADGKAEIVNGEIVRMSPAGGLHGWVAGLIFRSLGRHEDRTAAGIALPDNVGFIVDLPDRESFSPDAAWIASKPEFLSEDFIDGAPRFAVEVRSPKDYTPAGLQALATKITDYFAAGTLVVWDVDLRDDVIRCYRAADPLVPQVYRLDDIADAEPAVPGWRFPVKRLKRS
jgi:Uma2 family endonuclease